jgi:para-aminobenzoate synthetase/4-amino-4-deoxychorismate lyase
VATYGSGGGITWDSQPGGEWSETGAKLLGGAVSPETLIETFRYDPAAGPVNLDRHLRRLAASAAYFGIAFDAETAAKAVATALGGDTDGRRVKLVLDAGGTVEVLIADLPAPNDGPVRLAFSAEPVCSRDVALFHKSGDRASYERARGAAEDVVLWNERGEVTETTIANLAAKIGGRWVTPALGCGLLPGVERARLLDAGTIEEGVISKGALKEADEVAVFNSLRGWRAARLAAE